MKKGPKKYFNFEDYQRAADTFYAVCGMILFSFAKHKCDEKNIIIHNFVARAAMIIKAIIRLWEISDYQDAWVIHRSLLDRLFLLHELGEKNEFCEFEEWSFFEQYKTQNKVKSDPDFKHEAKAWFYNLTDEQILRGKTLSSNHPKWRRPRAETIAKSMDMEFLYKYGYDFASTLVHPMANDGQQDFFTITQLEPAPKFPTQISVISNSLLAGSMLLQEALNYSDFKWRQVLWDYLKQMRRFLDKGDMSYMESFIKLGNIFPENELCKE